MTQGSPGQTEHMKHIVVGVDGSDGSDRALQWALDQAAATSAEVDAVLVYDIPLAWIDVGSDYQAPLIEHAAKKAQEALHAILAEQVGDSSNVTVRPLVIDGTAADALVTASRGADLLVVGSRGRGGFTGLLLGSVSQRCVERSSCPVVVIPDPKSAHRLPGD